MKKRGADVNINPPDQVNPPQKLSSVGSWTFSTNHLWPGSDHVDSWNPEAEFREPSRSGLTDSEEKSRRRKGRMRFCMHTDQPTCGQNQLFPEPPEVQKNQLIRSQEGGEEKPWARTTLVFGQIPVKVWTSLRPGAGTRTINTTSSQRRFLVVPGLPASPDVDNWRQPKITFRDQTTKPHV